MIINLSETFSRNLSSLENKLAVISGFPHGQDGLPGQDGYHDRHDRHDHQGRHGHECHGRHGRNGRQGPLVAGTWLLICSQDLRGFVRKVR